MVNVFHNNGSLKYAASLRLISRKQNNKFCFKSKKNGRKITLHGVLDFEFGRKKLSPQVTTDSDTVFCEECIGEGFKIVTVAVFEKILLLKKTFLTKTN